MTFNQFITKLKEYKKLFILAGEIDTSTIRMATKGQWCCPITAVCLHETGVKYKTSEFVKAANDLGLSKNVYRDIADAADSPTAKPWMRKRLLNALK